MHGAKQVQSKGIDFNYPSGEGSFPSTLSQLDICLQTIKMAYEVIINSVNQRMDDMTRIHANNMAELKASSWSKIIELKDSLDYPHVEIEDLKSAFTCLKSESWIPSTKSACTCGIPASVSKRLDDVEVKLDYLENHLRCSNLRLNGISEEPLESWEWTEAKVANFIVKTLKLPCPSNK